MPTRLPNRTRFQRATALRMQRLDFSMFRLCLACFAQLCKRVGGAAVDDTHTHSALKINSYNNDILFCCCYCYYVCVLLLSRAGLVGILHGSMNHQHRRRRSPLNFALHVALYSFGLLCSVHCVPFMLGASESRASRGRMGLQASPGHGHTERSSLPLFV